MVSGFDDDDAVLLHERRKLRDWSVETVEAIEEELEVMVPRAHPVKEDLPSEGSSDLARDVE